MSAWKTIILLRLGREFSREVNSNRDIRSASQVSFDNSIHDSNSSTFNWQNEGRFM